MKKIAIVILALMLCCTSTLFAQGQKETKEKNSYVFAANCAWPPLEFVDEKGDVVGFEIDLVNEIATLSGKTITIRNVAWDGIFAGLANGSYDAVASGVSVTDERKPSMDFSTPIMTITQAIIAPKAVSDLTDVTALKNKTVGVQLGTTGHIYLEDYLKANPGANINIKAYDEIGFGIEDLLNGNLDCVVTDSVIASDYVLANANYAGKLHVTGTASTTGEPIAIAIKKGDATLLKLVNDSLATLEKNGTMDKLRTKWNIL
ncbi:transporter substrate-binding domain-containing protein [uncultured Sphaerochaeta sp.]|uniref:transporter substrate-binding domain-containing protein n=1 Tax=uncultured Sphaerochaeta sp. TaxID=886478 RepID=UPI002A0A565D|nr:transporter substrate-binding domain-containing protein [uncultured Sphaerochaeta sp.]